jgi:hypothetical protein
MMYDNKKKWRNNLSLLQSTPTTSNVQGKL